MYKIIFLCCLILALAEGHITDIETHTNHLIDSSRKQYWSILRNNDIKVHQFKEHYIGQVEKIKAELSKISSSSVHVKEHISHLETLSDLSKNCFFPTVLNSKTDITRCVVVSSNLVSNFLNGALSTRNALLNYYIKYFEEEISNCKKTCETTPAKYARCVISVISNTDTYTVRNQKTFESQIDVAIQKQKEIIRELWIAVSLFKLGQCNSIKNSIY